MILITYECDYDVGRQNRMKIIYAYSGGFKLGDKAVRGLFTNG